MSEGGALTKKIKWDLSALFKGDDDPDIEKNKAEVEEQARQFMSKWKERNDWLESPEALREALDDYESWSRNWGSSGDFGYYFWLRSTQDENDPEIKAKFSKAEELSKKIENGMRFFELRLARVPDETKQKFLNDKDLAKYRHFLERLFAEAKYLLSDEAENILNLKRTPAYSNWVKMISSFLSAEEREVQGEDGKPLKMGFDAILGGPLRSTKKPVRDISAKAINDILASHSDTATEEMNSVLANKQIDDSLRGMPRPDLSRHIADDIETETVDTLVETVAGSFDISKKYYELKAKLLQVPKLEYHERLTAYGSFQKDYSFDEAVSLVEEVFGRLDGEFRDIFKMFLDNGQIDALPNKGKRGGAFCAHNLAVQPTYILLNHTEKLNDVLTLAHELGHGINNEMMRKKQHGLYFGTPTSTAEVASTFMEDFVTERLMEDADDEDRLALMMEKLDGEVSTIFRQVSAYRFETELHEAFREKGYLSKEKIGEMFQAHMSNYMGEAVLQSPGSENWWVYWSHLRTYFYNYSYASGLLISKSLQRMVKSDKSAIHGVKGFLSAGMSDSPKNIFMKLDIDIGQKSFWQNGLKEVADLLLRTEELAKKLGKF